MKCENVPLTINLTPQDENTLKRNNAVILLPAHPASFAHTFVFGMQSFYFSESQDAIVLQNCH